MSAIDWTEIALRCGPMFGSLRRGVLKISNLGFFVLFVPNSERARVERELAAECLTIHGSAIPTTDEEESIFVVVVKSENADRLRAISNVAEVRSDSTWARFT